MVIICDYTDLHKHMVTRLQMMAWELCAEARYSNDAPRVIARMAREVKSWRLEAMRYEDEISEFDLGESELRNNELFG